MKTIGLICEGVSEFRIMNTVLSRFLGDDFVINPIEPAIVVKHGVMKQNSGGGWSRVLDHCNEQKFFEILQLNNYLVVQIDSDACQEYGVSPLDSNNRKKSPEVLYSDIVARLSQGFSSDFLQAYEGRILFAVCFDEIECWLLPLIYSDNNRCRTTNCIYTLNRELSRRNLPAIPGGDEKNSPNALKAYDKILKTIKNRKVVEDISVFNYGFKTLINNLSRIILTVGI